MRNRWSGPARVRTDSVHTTDQHLLAEIRDHLTALPLANELRHQDVETAKKLRAEIDALHDRVAYQDSVIRLLQRVTGVDAEKLTDEEIQLLVETGAMEPAAP